MAIPVLSNHDYGSSSRIINLPPATAPGQPATYEQLGTAPIGSITLDFGNIPVFSKTFSFSHVGALITQNVLMTVSAKMPVGVALDELEMDSISVSAYVSAPGIISVLAIANPGPIIGERNFNYQVG